MAAPQGRMHPGRDAIFWVGKRQADRVNDVAVLALRSNRRLEEASSPDTGKPIVRSPESQASVTRVRVFCPSLVGRQRMASAALYPKTPLRPRSRHREFSRAAFTGEKVPLVPPPPGQLGLDQAGG